MKTCNNCKTELMGKYCHNCRQEYFKNYSFKMLLNEGIKLLIVQKKLLSTLVIVLFWPRRINLDFGKGITIKYINPLAFFLLIIGLSFLISGNIYLGIPNSTASEFTEFLEFGIPALIASVLVGFIPYMKSTPLKILVMNLYAGAGMYFLFIISELINGLAWKYSCGIHGNWWVEMSPAIYLIYYYLNVYGIQLYKALTNFILFGVIAIVGFQLLDDTLVYTDLRPENCPTWLKNKAIISEEKMVKFSLAPISKSQPLITDVTGDHLRDALLVLENESNEKALLAFHYLENERKLYYFSELNLPSDSLVGITAVPDSWNVRLEFQNEGAFVIAWNGRIYHQINEGIN